MRTILFNVNVNMNCFVIFMDKNKNCSVCNIKLNINIYKKGRTVCKECYKKRKEKSI